jgi:hypothetical protein
MYLKDGIMSVLSPEIIVPLVVFGWLAVVVGTGLYTLLRPRRQGRRGHQLDDIDALFIRACEDILDYTSGLDPLMDIVEAANREPAGFDRVVRDGVVLFVPKGAKQN